MHHSSVKKILARGAFVVVALSSLGLAACGTGGGGSGGKALKLGTELPVSGTDAGVGLPTQYGVDLAVQQNKDLGSGYTLSVTHKNDVGTSGPDGSIGAANLQQLIADSSVMAVVGPFNSGVAKQEIPIANKNGLVLISPTNTNPGLTKQEFASENGINFQLLHPAGKPNYYFRLCGTDDVQGKVDADIALAAPVNATSAYVVDDSTTYGKGLANVFKQEFTSKGGTIAGSTSITPDQVSNLPQLATTIVSKNVGVVFYGGVTSGGGGALKKALVEKNGNMPLVGGDGIADDPSWLTTAGSAAVDSYGTVAAPDISGLTSGAAQTFINAYHQAFPGKDLLPYSAMAYDGAMIEIQAIKNLIKAGKTVTRAAVRDEVNGISYSGVTGQISFDTNGDNSGQKVFSVYGVGKDGKWAFVKIVNA
ncbi:MAG TPA: branched-chain amino acid ABC transporter substrate-binding protein [Ktedonobacterales bacterium]